jgi:hypothetical protein
MPQDFDWEALAARRMEPPRRPQETDHAKRKMELEDAHRGDPEVPAMTPEEVRECEVRGLEAVGMQQAGPLGGDWGVFRVGSLSGGTSTAPGPLCEAPGLHGQACSARVQSADKGAPPS